MIDAVSFALGSLGALVPVGIAGTAYLVRIEHRLTAVESLQARLATLEAKLDVLLVNDKIRKVARND